MDVNEHEILYNITRRHKKKSKKTALLLPLYIVAIELSITHTLK